MNNNGCTTRAVRKRIQYLINQPRLEEKLTASLEAHFVVTTGTGARCLE